jgi:uncharacterized membrane protein
MIDFTVETQIARPSDDVFAYATDPSKLGTWQTNTVSAVKETPGPVGLGTRIREIHSAPGGKELKSLVEVTEYEAGRIFALRVIEGIPIHGRITLEPNGPATVMRFRAHGRPTGFMGLLSPLLSRTLRRQFRRDCDRLKDLLEADDRQVA